MRLLADMHIAPRTVDHLRALGHDILRISELLPPTASDAVIVSRAGEEGRTVLTQDLDFSAIVALGGLTAPSLIVLRLASSRIEHVNAVLERTLPGLERDVLEGVVVTIEEDRIRRRRLPVS